jgi:hypothetical protein
MTRLRRLKKLKNQKQASMNKTASYVSLSSLILGSGDVIGISARNVNWEPWYQVYLEYDAGASSSFYDGPDEKRAYQMYCDLLTAFRGVSEAEKFMKNINYYKNLVNSFISSKSQDRQYHNLLMQKPSYLGYGDF